MADGIVQVDPDGTGKKVDTSELTRPDNTVVERERVVISDPLSTLSDALATVQDGSLKTAEQPLASLLELILRELKGLRLDLHDHFH